MTRGPDDTSGTPPGGVPSDAGPTADGSPSASSPAGRVDASRVRSFIGLSIGLVGPRARLAVAGVVITLFVQHRASGALAVTFALTAGRLLTWLTFPIAGRLSDRTRSRVGRRTPYMAASLIVMGIATWMYTVVSGYWLLVLMILIAGQAASIFTLTNVAVVPEVFGRSRWIKALLLTTVLGTVASFTIKGTVIASWKQNDPSTWNLPFQLAAVILVVVGIVVLLMVREAPNATFGAETDRRQRNRPVREELRDIMSGPNAKVLVGGSLLFWSGLGSTAYVAILFFQRVLHAGASAQTIAGLVTGLPVFFIGIALGVPLSRKLTPMQLAIGAPLIGAVLAGVQYFDTHLWQAVVLGYIGAPFVGAYIIVMAPLLLQLLPRAGGLGERLGVLLAPFNLCGVALAYVAAIVIDATGNYRLIWVFPAATGLAHATVNCWLKYPARNATSPDMVARLWEWSVVQAESMAEMGLVSGLLAAPLLGVVTKEDADSAVVIDMARNVLGNPYANDEAHTTESSSTSGAGAASGDQSDSETGGVTGVLQVGGGPLDGRAIGDQKFGWGEPSSTLDADGPGPEEANEAHGSIPVEGTSGTDVTGGVPSAGVGSTTDGDASGAGSTSGPPTGPGRADSGSTAGAASTWGDPAESERPDHAASDAGPEAGDIGSGTDEGPPST